MSYIQAITREELENTIKQFATGLMTVEEPTAVMMSDDQPLIHIPGEFSYVGTVKARFAPRQPTKTDIFPSEIFDKVREHVTEPSVLTTNDPRNESGQSPLVQGCAKYGKPKIHLPLKEFKFACNELRTHHTYPWPRKNEKLVPLRYILHGDGVGLNPIDLNSSPGHPYICEQRGKGKHPWITRDENDEMIMTNEIIVEVNSKLNKLFELERPFALWPTCLKTERRLKAKIKKGSTRVFQISNIWLTLIIRALCGDFINAFQRAKLQDYSAIGMDCESTEWQQLLNRWKRIGRYGFDGDFGAYDSLLYGPAIEECMNMISDWYDMYRPEGLSIDLGSGIREVSALQARQMRIILADELIHTNLITLNLVQQKHQGNPSGNPLTVILNTMVNAVYVRTAFAELHGCSYGTFDQNVCLIAYGDDNGISVSKQFEETFNFGTVAAVFFKTWGLEYTPADKGDKIILLKEINQLRFLKRTSRFNGFQYVPTIDLDTVYELTNWVRGTTDEDRKIQCRENCVSALKFGYFYGEQWFNKFKKKLDKALKDANLEPIPLPYSLLHQDFLTKLEG